MSCPFFSVYSAHTYRMVPWPYTFCCCCKRYKYENKKTLNTSIFGSLFKFNIHHTNHSLCSYRYHLCFTPKWMPVAAHSKHEWRKKLKNYFLRTLSNASNSICDKCILTIFVCVCVTLCAAQKSLVALNQHGCIKCYLDIATTLRAKVIHNHQLISHKISLFQLEMHYCEVRKKTKKCASFIMSMALHINYSACQHLALVNKVTLSRRKFLAFFSVFD